ncbi:hypothetical protein BDY19DRAFT_996875 [Irpex rosettiformis]|uniref:Uncharacterized protein n=1 Tax=Irpex rosettiformis TaxID=378272 RepID=A0ACB8TTH4_9APHY|nr:hypothetical protein BDY19DRAFT_996875 [Irpex rosettiformis]
MLDEAFKGVTPHDEVYRDSPKYRGRNSLIQPSDFEKCKHTSSNWFLKTAGKDSAYFARMTRFISGHFPHGSFRERFNFEGNRKCLCGKANVETKDIIWFDCDLWIRKHKPPDLMNPDQQGDRRRDALDFRSPTPPGMSREEHIIAEWRNSPPDLKDVAEFLQLNPIVGTFQWLDLAEKAITDHGRDEINSITAVKVRLHTSFRKEAFRQ